MTTSDDPRVLDTPTERADIRKLTIQQHERWITEIQERRLSARKRLDAVEAAKIGAHIESLSEKLDTVLAQLAKKSATIDKAQTQFEEKLRKAEALRMEIDYERGELAKRVPDAPTYEPSSDDEEKSE